MLPESEMTLNELADRYVTLESVNALKSGRLIELFEAWRWQP
jgi:hypothetical protein